MNENTKTFNDWLSLIANLLIFYALLFRPLFQTISVYFLKKTIKKTSPCIENILNNKNNNVSDKNNCLSIIKAFSIYKSLEEKSLMLGIEDPKPYSLLIEQDWKAFDTDVFRKKLVLWASRVSLPINGIDYKKFKTIPALEDFVKRLDDIYFWNFDRDVALGNIMIYIICIWTHSGETWFASKETIELASKILETSVVDICGCGECQVFQKVFWELNDLEPHVTVNPNGSNPLFSLTLMKCNVKLETPYYWVSLFFKNCVFVEGRFSFQSIMGRIAQTRFKIFTRIFLLFFSKNEDYIGYTTPQSRREFNEVFKTTFFDLYGYEIKFGFNRFYLNDCPNGIKMRAVRFYCNLAVEYDFPVIKTLKVPANKNYHKEYKLFKIRFLAVKPIKNLIAPVCTDELKKWSMKVGENQINMENNEKTKKTVEMNSDLRKKLNELIRRPLILKKTEEINDFNKKEEENEKEEKKEEEIKTLEENKLNSTEEEIKTLVENKVSSIDNNWVMKEIKTDIIEKHEAFNNHWIKHLRIAQKKLPFLKEEKRSVVREKRKSVEILREMSDYQSGLNKHEKNLSRCDKFKNVVEIVNLIKSDKKFSFEKTEDEIVKKKKREEYWENIQGQKTMIGAFRARAHNNKKREEDNEKKIIKNKFIERNKITVEDEANYVKLRHQLSLKGRVKKKEIPLNVLNSWTTFNCITFTKNHSEGLVTFLDNLNNQDRKSTKKNLNSNITKKWRKMFLLILN